MALVSTVGADNKILRIDSKGTHTLFTYGFPAYPSGIAVDANGDLIVVEEINGKFSRITPFGVRTEIFDFLPTVAQFGYPECVGVGTDGSFATTRNADGVGTLAHVTPAGVLRNIFPFGAGIFPFGVVESARFLHFSLAGFLRPLPSRRYSTTV